MNERRINICYYSSFNVELYLERCLKSIIRQDYYNIEIVLVDDGSTDGSGKICDLYACKDTRIKVIHKKNGGLSDARNKGLDVATGEYISFIDSDDWIEYSMYSQLMNELQKNNADIIICGRYRAYNNGKKRVEKYRKYPINNLMSTEEALGNLMTFTGFDMSFCDKIFKKSLFDGICFPFAKTCEDSYVMYQIIAKAQRIYYYEKPFYNYFIGKVVLQEIIK